MNTYCFNFRLLAVTILALAALFFIAFFRVTIDTDIIGTLPQHDPVIADARYVLLNHPIQDQIALDVAHAKKDPDILAAAGKIIEEKMAASGLFASVGFGETAALIPELMEHILSNLPVLYTAHELETIIAPMLSKDQMRKKLETALSELSGMDGIGQAQFIARDPLGLKNPVMARLQELAPSNKARIHKNHLLSSDGKHLLILARPAGSGTDTAFARKAVALFDTISSEINREFAAKAKFTLTPVGAFRAALDNEEMARQDTRQAIWFSTTGIALLLLFAFPRPWIGLLSLIPAIAGTITAFFVYSLFYRSISVLTLGFGGAVIAITVDHGIAYMLFLDRPHATFGEEAAREVRSIGLIAALTTVGAFLTLSFSGFSILGRIGQFAAMGIGFSFLFVHTVFPLIIPSMPPARRGYTLPLQKLADRLFNHAKPQKALATLLLFSVMLIFAKPVFHVDLKSMNTIRPKTAAAEKLVTGTWGDIFSKIFLVTKADSLKDLQVEGDRITALIEDKAGKNVLKKAFVPNLIFPGEQRAAANFSSWKQFWTPERVDVLKINLEESAASLGFAGDAFHPFYKTIMMTRQPFAEMPSKFFRLLGISQRTNPDPAPESYFLSDSKARAEKWILFSTLSPGPAYDAPTFFSGFSSTQTKVFDPRFFADRLGSLLGHTFIKMVVIIGISMIVLLSIFFFNLKLAIAASLPVVFALVCTLGTLKLMGRPLDLPSLMLSIVVMGMGVDYSLFLVRSRQRYRTEIHPNAGLIRMAVFLASGSTLIGFGVLSLAGHNLLKSAGLTSFIGIGYALLGAFCILPYVLDQVMGDEE